MRINPWEQTKIEGVVVEWGKEVALLIMKQSMRQNLGAVEIVRITRYFGRVADHATNIAHRVVYRIGGKMILHAGSR